MEAMVECVGIGNVATIFGGLGLKVEESSSSRTVKEANYYFELPRRGAT